MVSKNGFSFFVLCICCITSSFPWAESDIKNLYTLRGSFAKTKGLLPSWFDTETPPCNWSGVTCDGHTVIAIDLSYVPLCIPFPSDIVAFQSLMGLYLRGCGISGEIPESLGNLRLLQYLDLSNSKLTGLIPASLYNLKMVKEIVLDNNSFSGQLSPAIAQLHHLTKLSISMNSISGELPLELGSLQKLERLYLGRNHFTGRIPNEICNLKWLKVLSLFECNLSGSIPWSIGRMESLQELDLSGNNFKSELPASIGELKHLSQLRINSADLRGSIPKELSNCKKLAYISLSTNALNGSIPKALADLEAISYFLVDNNKLSGHIPYWIQKWGSALQINLANNKLNGSIPSSICQGNSLQSLILHGNNLTGNIDKTFIGCKSLIILNLQGNRLHGEIPEYLAELPLEKLDLSYNNFTGVLPSKLWESSTILDVSLRNNQLFGMVPENIGNLRSLQLLDMGHNFLEGPIPPSIGALSNLSTLFFDGNRLSGDIPQELFKCKNLVTLSMSSNNLTGHIPRAIAQLTQLTSLILSHNQLSGLIPDEICSVFTNAAHSEKEYIQHHGLLDLSYNQLTGRIPASIKNCSILVELHLQGNSLNGSIPAELCELANLRTVDLSFNSLIGPMLPCSMPLPLQGLCLSNNHLYGNIPSEIGYILPNITTLDLSNNALMDTLPQPLLCSKSLYHLDVSNNNLSGQIPLSCDGDSQFSSRLVFFNASFNHFSGSLGESISNFTQLSSLDIHNNSLTGSLPSALSNASLNYLDLSNNDFSGPIPHGICNIAGLTFANFSGNHVSLHSLSDCSTPCICTASRIDGNRVPHPSHLLLRALAICAIAFTIVVMLVPLVFYVRGKLSRSGAPVLLPAGEAMVTIEPTSSDEQLLVRKSREPPSINLATFESVLLRVNSDDILKATDNFSEVHIIGDGGFGTVYRAALPEGQRVAIKRLHVHRQFEGDRGFLAEMETIGKVKHRNLVPLLGYCVRDDERFLIYEYMHHGSLETWLRNRADNTEPLGWSTRLKICLGSARGLMFLHHGFVPHIIHRDMKSSNILLDENMEPRVSDFGLARIISAYETHVSTNVAGSLGYIPPEYGLAMRCTTKGDVYSFGVVMLEVLTARPPTGQEMEEGGGNLVGWVRWMIAHGRQDELFDPRLEISELWREQMLHVLAIAQECTADDPYKRPTMVEVVKGLRMIQLMNHEPHEIQEHEEQS